MTREEHVRQIEKFVGHKEPRPTPDDLNEILSVHDELGLWIDMVTSVSVEQALLCWRIVESVRGKEFPYELRM